MYRVIPGFSSVGVELDWERSILYEDVLLSLNSVDVELVCGTNKPEFKKIHRCPVSIVHQNTTRCGRARQDRPATRAQTKP
ncbi:hypothetical protein AMELA_G00263160 [Ameiurus melas]|uniref:Uncharacterized protein n=1 Tax=Ameiurus melas TaxID=219545 RepID=A0A7J5ZRQ8_AMEME|nr:hypothetical protein AMELA_G00263160 [Ameiurus melas]